MTSVISKCKINDNPEDKFGLLRCSISEELRSDTIVGSGIAEEDTTRLKFKMINGSFNATAPTNP